MFVYPALIFGIVFLATLILLRSAAIPRKIFRAEHCKELFILWKESPAQQTKISSEATIESLEDNEEIDAFQMTAARKTVYITPEEIRDESHPYKQLIRAVDLVNPPCRIWMEGKKLKGEVLDL